MSHSFEAEQLPVQMMTHLLRLLFQLEVVTINEAQGAFQPTRYDDDILSVLSISSFLDPHYRSLSFLSNDEKESVKLAVEREATSISQSSSQAPDSVGCGKPPSKKLRALLDLVSDVIEPCISKDTVGKVASEVRMYAGEVQVKEDPLMWWRNHKSIYPHLAHLAQNYLNIPATSVPCTCERAFSKAGHIVNAKRACLLPETVYKLVFLSENLN